ncbi:MAG: hypothetical protein JWM59_3293 [Verrucomicrobiales bacterium]|nr:hypothetical protein [Verrucomicrobiales bacterium]
MRALNVRPASDAGGQPGGSGRYRAEAIQHEAMSKQFEQIRRTHLMEWPDPGRRRGIMLNAGHALISPTLWSRAGVQRSHLRGGRCRAGRQSSIRLRRVLRTAPPIRRRAGVLWSWRACAAGRLGRLPGTGFRICVSGSTPPPHDVWKDGHQGRAAGAPSSAYPCRRPASGFQASDGKPGFRRCAAG